MQPYKKTLKPFSQTLRKNQTEAEQILWSRLRRKQILDVQFYRQKPLLNYIVDFYCAAANLVIELDGSQHFEPQAQEYDNERTKQLETLDLRVIRFTNAQIFNELENVMEVIYGEIRTRAGV